MAEETHATEVAPAYGGPPRWMIWTGCGCLVPGFLLVATVAYYLQTGRELVDQERAWTMLGETVRYDDSARGTETGAPDDPSTAWDESRRPGEFEFLLGGPVPISTGDEEAYYFGRDVPTPFEPDRPIGPNPLRITIVKLLSDRSDGATRASAGTPAHEDGTIEVNGEALRVRWIPKMTSEGVNLLSFRIPDTSGAGAAVWMRRGVPDPEDADRTFDVIAFFQRPGSGRRVEEAEIRAFLEPFEVSNAPPKPTVNGE